MQKHKFELLLCLLFFVCFVAVWPLGNYPLNDDWAYSKSVVILCEENRLDIGEWGAMTLFTHLVWGSLFVKIFGFSFTILRISTLFSSLIGVLFLYKTVLSLTGRPRLSLFAACILLFYPIYFNLSNTYMTDVNFNTLLILAVYNAVQFHLNRRRAHFVFVFVIAAAMVLLRQFGILVPFCFALSCLFVRDRKARTFLLSLVAAGCVYGIYILYEKYLKSTLSDGAAYKFSGAFNLWDPEFYLSAWRNFLLRWKMVVVHLSIYILPFTLLLLFQLWKILPRLAFVLIVSASALIAHTVFHTINPFQGNIFSNMSLGAETWFESLSDLQPDHAHTYSPVFQSLMEMVRFIGLTSAISCAGLISAAQIRRRQQRVLILPEAFFIWFFLFSYCGTLMLSESYFDRYHLPLVTVLLVALSRLFPHEPVSGASFVPAAVILFFFAACSVAGTRDYFTMNNVRWQAYLDLRDGQGIDGGTVNSGFEVNCWNDGKPGWWTNMLCTEPYTYLIQYREEQQFSTIRKYPFMRVFPPRTDTVRVMKRTSYPP